jgi:hypothetical protein
VGGGVTKAYLKGQCHEISDFFLAPSFPGPLIIP